MRIAMIASQVPPAYGGAGTQALALAAKLAARGVQVDILTQNQELAAAHQLVDGICIRRCPGERLIRLLGRLDLRLAEIARTAVYTLWLLAQLSRRTYDIHHVHGNYWFGLAPAMVGRLKRVPLVLKVTRLGDDDADTVTSKRAAGIPLGSLYSTPTRLASMVVALNAEIAARHRRHFPRVPFVLLPNGVDAERFRVTPVAARAAREALEIPSDSDVALFAGYLTSLKGVGELLEAWQRLVAKRDADGPDAVLLLVGPGASTYRYVSSEAASFASSVEAADLGIRVIDHVAPSAMPVFYAAADVFVLPSRSEGMPNSLLEAVAAGIPIVATAIPGIVDVLEPAADVALLPAPCPDLIADALADAFRQKPHLLRRSRRLPSRFDLDDLAVTYQQMFADLALNGACGPTLRVSQL